MSRVLLFKECFPISKHLVKGKSLQTPFTNMNLNKLNKMSKIIISSEKKTFYLFTFELYISFYPGIPSKQNMKVQTHHGRI